MLGPNALASLASLSVTEKTVLRRPDLLDLGVLLDPLDGHDVRLNVGGHSDQPVENLDQKRLSPGNTKRGSITVPLTSCMTAWELAV